MGSLDLGLSTFIALSLTPLPPSHSPTLADSHSSPPLDSPSQFLPQDKVTEFATMSPVQLLEATEKAIGDSTLHRLHQSLVDLKKTYNEDKQVTSPLT